MEEKKNQTEPEACKVTKKCGGCQYQGVPYKEQLKKKQKKRLPKKNKIIKNKDGYLSLFFYSFFVIILE